MTTVLALAELDAKNTAYTPAVATDWNGDVDPGDADDALDQLAARVKGLESTSAPASIDPTKIMTITGAGSEAVNCSVGKTGSNNFGPIWQNGMTGVRIEAARSRDGNLWLILLGDDLYYYGSWADSPDMVSVWVADSGGSLPVPTVTAESAPFTDKVALFADGNGGASWQDIVANKINSSDANSGDVLTADGAGGTEWREPAGGEGGGLPYAVYAALLNQSGENAPVATVLENTLGGEITWTREGVGIYAGTLAGGFDPTKTFLRCTNFVNSKFASVSISGISQIEIATYLPSDGDLGVYNPTDNLFLLSPIFVEIRVYGATVGGSGGVPSVAGANNGDVLTVDGGVATWQAPVSGGGGIPYLGNVGQPDTSPTGAEISAAYASTTGEAPANGAIATLVDNGGPEFSLAAYWSDQGLWYRVAFGGAFS